MGSGQRRARCGPWSPNAIGDETPPDYLSSVQDGGFYSWTYCYWDRVSQDPALVAKAITPDYALGGHTASLGLCWPPAETLPGFSEGTAIGQHGSWIRGKLSGYRLVFSRSPTAARRTAARYPLRLPVGGRTKRSRTTDRSG